MPVEHVVEEGNQRRAFSARGHVGGAEIRDDGDAEPGGEDGGFARLPGARDGAAEERPGVALMVERLSVTADEFALQTRAPLRSADRIGIEFAQQEIQAREIGDAGGAGVHGGENRAAHLGWEGKLIVRQQFESRAKAASLDAHQSDVDAVRRGAAHDAGDDQDRAPARTALSSL